MEWSLRCPQVDWSRTWAEAVEQTESFDIRLSLFKNQNYQASHPFSEWGVPLILGGLFEVPCGDSVRVDRRSHRPATLSQFVRDELPRAVIRIALNRWYNMYRRDTILLFTKMDKLSYLRVLFQTRRHIIICSFFGGLFYFPIFFPKKFNCSGGAKFLL